jgi:hypothetical protein
MVVAYCTVSPAGGMASLQSTVKSMSAAMDSIIEDWASWEMSSRRLYEEQEMSKSVPPIITSM